MNYQEAIEQLKFDMEMITFDPYTGEIIPLEVLKNRNNDNYKAYIADELAIKAMGEVQEYMTIGTLEEVREAVEKQKEKKPKEQSSTEKTHYKCPDCGYIMMIKYEDGYRLGNQPDYCERCGQHIDWSEEDD